MYIDKEIREQMSYVVIGGLKFDNTINFHNLNFLNAYRQWQRLFINHLFDTDGIPEIIFRKS